MQKGLEKINVKSISYTRKLGWPMRTRYANMCAFCQYIAYVILANAYGLTSARLEDTCNVLFNPKVSYTTIYYNTSKLGLIYKCILSSLRIYHIFFPSCELSLCLFCAP